MAMYKKIANVYDHMMNHIPYDEWFGKIRDYLAGHGVTEGTICELGCGTGTMTERFAAAGFQMIGVDRSPEMLAVARNKKDETNLDILYLEQDMEHLELAEPTDVVLSVCDSMNYILQENALENVFRRVHDSLKPGGYFVFDLKTVYCYRNVIGNKTWVEQDEDVSYIWENYFYEDGDINEYALTIFRRKPDSGLYERIEEAHYQRAYTIPNLEEMLSRCGLAMIDCFDESMEKPPTENSERIYIVAKRMEDVHEE